MLAAEKHTHNGDADGARKKDEGRAFRGVPQIVSAPSKRLRRVSIQGEAAHQPNGQHQPRISRGILKPPDEPGDQGGEGKSFDERQET